MMMKKKNLCVVWLACMILLAVACKSGDPDTSSQEPDTRKWVREAFDRVDPMKITVSFNNERVSVLKSMLDQETSPERRLNLGMQYAYELLKAGRTAEAIDLFQTVIQYINDNNVEIDPASKRNLYSMFGIAYLRHGEIENCVQNHNHESCFLPIAGGGVHQLPYGSRNAIVQFEACLKEFPEDLETMYLLNLAYMTLGEFPDKVPSRWRIDPSWFSSKVKIQSFKDVAAQLGLNRNGLAGGVVVDDFTNDGWLDIVITSFSHQEELIFYINNGDGTFSDQTSSFGLDGQVGILNLNQTDFNNDGWLDLYLMRGAWFQDQGDIPNTLMMNTGKGSFTDVTLQAGLTHVAPTQASAWADFNLDGWLDLVVANESLPGFDRGIDLYINQKNGTFSHESATYGLMLNKFFKGCVVSDINNDRYPDIYFTSRSEGNFLFINQGASGTKGFVEMGAQTQMNGPVKSFPCWSFDYNNDGHEDIFVSAYTIEGPPALHWMLSNQGKADPSFLPKLYSNKGNLVFEEVGVKMGLTEIAFTMGCNFGDINTDGFLDFYLGTGTPFYQSIVPNKMYLNMNGERFEDVSYSGGFANVQKGHGVSFGDLDHDGDEDLYTVIGGAYDGDSYFNCLFENPNQDQHNWVVLKFEGTLANKAAIGARVMISVQENGQERKIYRTVTSGASFGANSLALEVGLRKATSINSVSVQWPCRDCQDQKFTGLEINKAYQITQDMSTPRLLEYQYVPLASQVSLSSKGEHQHH